jgi:ATP-dependent DNA ligase
MPDIEDGDSAEVQGSARDPYILKNTGGVYSCTCPAWRNQSLGIEQRTCKHLRQYRGDEAEMERLGGALPGRPVRAARSSSSGTAGGSASSADSDAPPILLAHPWDSQSDLTGWWISEKLDGVRAYWDGKQFISRQGNVYMAPDWFVEGLPDDIHLDGELWSARKQFQRTVSIVRRQDKNADWKEVTFVVFDAPKMEVMFEERLEAIELLLKERAPKYARAHEHIQCQGTTHLREELLRVESLGGEGLMVRKPRSKYEKGRSFTLLKVKTFHDAEALVIEHQPGAGKHKGRLGALGVELADGTKFSVGTGFSDYQREHPPAIGSIITFRYQELSDSGVPRFPSFVRERTDIDSLTDNVPGRTAGSPAGSPAGASPKPAGTSPPEAVSTVSKSVSAAANPITGVAARRSAPGPAIEPISMGESAGAKLRRFKYQSDGAEVLWDIEVDGVEVRTRFQKDGSVETSSKSFSDPSGAANFADKQVARKLNSGFTEL